MTTTTTLSVGERRRQALERLASPAIVLTTIVVLGTLARLMLALQRPTPRYLPDEFLYTQIAASLGRGEGVSVLGQPSNFPALLEPILTSVFWRSGDAELAMGLTQVLHAAAGSLAALPVYSLARRVGLAPRIALLCAGSAVLAPGLFYVGSLNSDAVGYLLALCAIDLGVRALNKPTTGSQLAALGAIGLATFCRLQYAALAIAFVVSALGIERGRIVRAARAFTVTAGLSVLGLAIAVLGGARVLGRYDDVRDFRPSISAAEWALSSLMLLVVAVGVTLAFPAIAWFASALRHPTNRGSSAYAWFVTSSAVVTLLITSLLTAETLSNRFIERYLIVFAPLAAIGFAAWNASGRPNGRLVGVLAAVGILAIARAPLSAYVTGQGTADSPTLMAARRFEIAVGIGTADLIMALGITTAMAVVAITAFRRRMPATPAVLLAAACFLLTSIGASVADKQTGTAVLRGFALDQPTFVDDATSGEALLVQTPVSSRLDAMLLGIWNTSIRRAAWLQTDRRLPVEGIDGMRDKVAVARDGVLSLDGEPMTGTLVFALGGTAAAFDDARVKYDRRFVLVEPQTTARLSMLAEGIRSDGKVTQVGRIQVFPRKDGRCTRLAMTFDVPVNVPPTTLEFRDEKGGVKTIVAPSGRPSAPIILTSSALEPTGYHYRTLTLGGRKPSGSDFTVANARFSTRAIPCPPQES